YNAKVGLLICCPITTQIKGYPFEVQIPAGLAIKGVILADQVKSLDWRIRKIKFIGCVPKATVRQVQSKLRQLLK
ncbi:MAG TPA: mRNA-degrading endonuclease, partial [Anaerolineae bacterium]|nr:mRNA-degrading endonuclease [Anaerolineae bacterium]